MLKRLIDYIVLVLTALLLPLSFSSCQDEEMTGHGTAVEVPEGYKLLSFKADIPDMVEVTTRAIDEDGGGVQDLRLFCFNNDGLFLSSVKADITPDGDPSGVNVIEGKYTAVIPENTQIVHFIANINPNFFNETAMLGKRETEVIPLLTVSSGFMIYWQRVELSAGTAEGNNVTCNVTLLRNQARFQISEDSEKKPNFTVCNTTAYGTVAPFNVSATGNEFVWNGDGTDVTLPADKNYQVRLIPREEPTSAISYVFETENSETNPVYIILKDQNLYYKALVIDTDGNFVNIRRNTSYDITITGELSNGYRTLDEAIDGIATNNVWISIADNIRTISDGQFELSVENTVFVYESSETTQQATIGFSYKALSTGVTVTAPTVSLVENNETITGLSSTFSGTEGSIGFTVNSLPPGESMRKAVILVKEGVLQRKITIYVIKKFEFTPSWVSTQVDANQAGEPVTLMFTIPEDFPTELFPFDVKIGADWLNVRESGGQVLSIITPTSNPEDFNNPDNFPDGDDPWTFKFVYRAEQPGVQRVYFNTTLPPTGAAEPGFDKALLTIEADHFTMMKKQISFTESGNFITLSNLLAVSGSDLGGNMPQDDDIYYRLVPQKKNAQVFFTVNTKKEDSNGISNVPVREDDEFLIYTNYLTYYTDGELTSLGIDKECDFLENPVISGIGNGYYQAFKPLNSGGSVYNIYMKTTRTNSEEVIRIASHEKGYPALFDPQGQDYSGQYFRSITFELANYHAFNFFASVTKARETTPYTEWTYEPDQQIDVQFDVTSFRGADNRSADPFGTEFKVYIDAPMLEIDEERRGYTSDVFYEESAGRFVLLIKADRDNNRLGNDNIATANLDKNNGQIFENYEPAPDADQTGEHHVLPFRKKNIVSEGNIVISADPEIVNFTSETIEISNKPVTGTIKYQDGDVPTDVPAGAFVTFALQNDDTRIGVMNITTAGQYSMQLRSVYQFSWVTDPVVVKYRIGNTAYTAEYPNLQTFVQKPNVTLTLQNEP